MTVAFDAFASSGDEPGTSISWTHTPVGTPRGVLVLIAVNQTTTDTVTTVTYGGTAMSEVALSPLTRTTENGAVVHGFFLGSSVPTGAQTVEATTDSGFNQEGFSVSYTAGADTEVVDTSVINTSGVGDLTGTLSLGGRTCHCSEIVASALNAPAGITPLTGWTSQSEGDWGGQMRACYTYDTVGSSDVTFGLNHANSAEVAVLGVAVAEVAPSGDGVLLGSAFASATDGSDPVIDISGLGLQEDDTVYVCGFALNEANTGLAAVLTSGYTQIATRALFGADATAVERKVMGASPDSSVTCQGTGETTIPVLYVAVGVRGLDTTTPEDVTTVTAGSFSGNPDPGSIDPASSGAISLVFACKYFAAGGQSLTAGPSGYTDFAADAEEASSQTIAVGVAALQLSSGDAEDPGAFTASSSGSSWAAFTVALRPAADGGGDFQAAWARGANVVIVGTA